MGLTLVTPPAGEPVSLAAAKAHLRANDTDDEDDLIVTYIQAAREYVEGETGYALYTQTWDYTQNDFPCYGDVIQLGRAPIQSITYIKYIDSSGVLTTLASTEYIVDASLPLSKITLGYQKSWPAYRSQANAITVRFVAGYGTTPNAVPMKLRAAVLFMTGSLYFNREAVIEPPVVTRLLDGYRTRLVA